jgi:hypothetical protein
VELRKARGERGSSRADRPVRDVQHPATASLDDAPTRRGRTRIDSQDANAAPRPALDGTG